MLQAVSPYSDGQYSLCRRIRASEPLFRDIMGYWVLTQITSLTYPLGLIEGIYMQYPRLRIRLEEEREQSLKEL